MRQIREVDVLIIKYGSTKMMQLYRFYSILKRVLSGKSRAKQFKLQ